LPPRTIPIAGNGQTAVTFELPLSRDFKVQSVYAVIDTTGGSASPTLIVSDASGAVIAKKPQAQALNAGAADETATWALRLADDGGGGTTVGAGKTGFYVNAGQSVGGGNNATLAWTALGGDALLDLSVPTLPTFLADGNYGVTGVVELTDHTASAVAGKGSLVELDLLATGGGPGLVASADWTVWGVGGINPVRQPVTLGAVYVKAGDTLRLQVTNGQTNAMVYDFYIAIHSIFG